MLRYIFLSFPFLFYFYANASVPKIIAGESLTTSKSINIPLEATNKKGLVVVFMSAKCPCSNSHVKILKKLPQKYKDFKFVGVHSNADESKEIAQTYFKSVAFGFDVIEDQKSFLADQLQAYKTPHVFVISTSGEVLYQGGITNSAHADSADKNYLEEALEDISQNKKIRTSEGRTLGCIILRESEIR